MYLQDNYKRYSGIGIRGVSKLVVLTALVNLEQYWLPVLEVTHVTAELGRAGEPLEVVVEGLLCEGEGSAGWTHLILHLQPEQSF